MASVVGSAGTLFLSSANKSGSSYEQKDVEMAILSLESSVTREDGKVYLRNFIDGQWCFPSVEKGDTFLECFNPALDEVSCLVPRSQSEDVNKAVNVATAAQASWGATSSVERACILEKAAVLLRGRLESLAFMESSDCGKPVRLARAVDIPRAAENFEFFARMIRTDSTGSHAMPDAVNFTQRCPVGVSGLVTPWNLPLYLLTWKVAPALANGNCIIAKPSELTPLTACALAEILREAGLPDGVFQLVHGLGSEAGSALVSHPKVRLVSFTGGTATGQKVATLAAPHFKKVSLELGGKNPAIVFADCDLDKAVEGVSRGTFLNSGQICLCCPRILVQREIYEKFRDRLVDRARKIVVGDPLDLRTENGPVVSAEHLRKIQGCVQMAVEDGGKVLCGGSAPDNALEPGSRVSKGYFISPTVIEGLSAKARVAQEEIFGPVCTLHTFDSEEEAIALANDVEYGLAASVWTKDGSKALRVIKNGNTF